MRTTTRSSTPARSSRGRASLPGSGRGGSLRRPRMSGASTSRTAYSTVDIYRCPTGIRGEVLTYAIVDALNGATSIPGTKDVMIKRLNQIKRPGERFVFIDEGRISPDSWTVHYNKESWWDRPTVRHGDGTNFSTATTGNGKTRGRSSWPKERFPTPHRRRTRICGRFRKPHGAGSATSRSRCN